MLKDKAGNRLFRSVKVKVIFPDALFPDKIFTQHAGPRQGFGPEGVDAMLENIAEQLDSLYPWWNFKPIELRPEGRTAKFAFIFAGNNTNYVAPAPVKPIADSSTPEPAPLEDITPLAITEAVGTTLQDLAAQATVQS